MYDLFHCTQQKYYMNNGSCVSKDGTHLINKKSLCKFNLDNYQMNII